MPRESVASIEYRKVMRVRILLLYALVVSIATIGATSARSSVPFRVPAIYVGFLPCGDCGGPIATILTVRTDGTYRERQFFRRGRPEESKGTWRYEYSSNALILSERSINLPYFRVIDAMTLEPLDYMGDPIPAAAEFDLERCPVSRLQVALRLTCERGLPPPPFLH